MAFGISNPPVISINYSESHLNLFGNLFLILTKNKTLYTSSKEECNAKDFDVKIGYIERITFNPWIAESLYKPIKATLKTIKGCKKLKICRTTILENERWKEVADKLKNDS
ncbi:MAG: hypothetical protein AB7U85_04360 [Alphaproteobacteria bacterium]